MRKLFLLCFATSLLWTGLSAQEQVSYKEPKPYKNWVKMVPGLNEDFYKTEEATRIADNVLLYQLNSGGWPKNIYMPQELTAKEREEAIAAKADLDEGTIDNDATTTEIFYLANVYNATGIEKYKEGVMKGLDFLFEAQYDNGGWPQCYPRKRGYHINIQYNDDSNVNVLNLMREVYEGKLYSFLPTIYQEKARTAFDKGIDCILKTQVKQNGKLTAWCAQYDPVTLEPAAARAFELVSLSGQESDELVLMLMSVPPTPEIIEAVEGAVQWFREVEIHGIKKEYFTDNQGRRDYRIVPCTDCPPSWARFYDIETNTPFFCDRDGVKRYDLSEIGHERRNGYSWYNNDGLKVYKEYEKWKKRL